MHSINLNHPSILTSMSPSLAFDLSREKHQILDSVPNPSGTSRTLPPVPQPTLHFDNRGACSHTVWRHSAPDNTILENDPRIVTLVDLSFFLALNSNKIPQTWQCAQSWGGFIPYIITRACSVSTNEPTPMRGVLRWASEVTSHTWSTDWVVGYPGRIPPRRISRN